MKRRKLGSASAAIDDDEFCQSLRVTLEAWGLGRRGSNLVSSRQFRQALQERREDIVRLDGALIEDDTLKADLIAGAIWSLIENLGIVDNTAKIVAGSKALHHLLPDLIVPMDRQWTRAFFGWTQADPQSNQERTFRRTYLAYVRVARLVQPQQYVRSGWRTSSTKILDNAVIGYCMANDIGAAN